MHNLYVFQNAPVRLLCKTLLKHTSHNSRNMNREKLIQVATNLIAWTNSKPVTATAFARIVSPQLKVPIPYPGQSPDYEGLLALTQAAHVAAPDFKMIIKDTVVDETTSTVVLLLNITGTHVKYLEILSS